MYFTKRKLIMFIFVVLQIAKIAFNAALYGGAYTLFNGGELSILLFLVLLYVDQDQHRRYSIPFAAAFYIVSIIWVYFEAPNLLLNVSTIFVIMLVVGTYFFGLNSYHDSFRDQLSNWIITIGCAVYIGYLIYIQNPILSIIISQGFFGDIKAMITIPLNYLSRYSVPLAMIIYTWFRRYRID